MVKQFKIINLGLVDYDKALKFQMELAELRSEGKGRDSLILCSHPSVVTLGRGSLEGDLQGWEGEVKQVNRGGRATYHGPGQLVGYPIVSLKGNSNLVVKEQDVRVYLEAIEQLLISTLNHFGVEASVESGQPLGPGQLNRGVWVKGKKVASIGIAVKRWVTMHGFALNVKKDPLAFSGIQACGFQKQDYTSMEEQGVSGLTIDAVAQFMESLFS